MSPIHQWGRGGAFGGFQASDWLTLSHPSWRSEPQVYKGQIGWCIRKRNGSDQLLTSLLQEVHPWIEQTDFETERFFIVTFLRRLGIKLDEYHLLVEKQKKLRTTKNVFEYIRIQGISKYLKASQADWFSKPKTNHLSGRLHPRQHQHKVGRVNEKQVSLRTFLEQNPELKESQLTDSDYSCLLHRYSFSAQ